MLRRIFTCGGALVAFALAGCHGGGSSLDNAMPSINPNAATTAGANVNGSSSGTTRRTMGVISTSGSTSTVAGTVVGGTTSEFEINAGSGCGYVNVSTTSSTTWSYNGLTLTSGTPVTIVATGSCGTSFAASSVTLGSSSGTPNLTGTIVGVSGNTINVNGGSGCGYVNVTYTSSTPITYNGYTLTSGVTINVWGSGSCATSFSATSITLGASSGAGSPNLTGTIYGVSGNTISVNGGSGCGYVNVTYTSSTPITYNGYSLASGTPIEVWGSGSCATSFTATSITLGSGASAPNLSGTIYGVSGDTINVNGGSGCGYVNVTYSSSTSITYNGYSIAAGTPIEVWGSGSCSTSYTATSIVLGEGGSSGGSGGSGGSTSMTHVLTSDYLDGIAGTTTVSPSTAATVLSWAEVPIQDASAVAAAGIKTLDYIDPFEQATTDPLYNSTSSTFSTTCSGSRITVDADGVTQYLMNPSSSTLESLMNSWQASQESQGTVSAFFYDDVDDLYDVSALPCDATQSSWDAEDSSFIASSSYPVVFNGYGMNSDAEALLGNNSKVTGGMIEDCYGTTTGSTEPYQVSSWTGNENLEINAVNVGKLFFCYNTPTSSASSSIAVRNYIYASFLIGYGPSSSVLWEYFSTPSNVHVFPETKLVPLNPLISSASSVSSYAKGSVYVREYANCYLAGSSIGHCAAVVNPSSSSYSMPSMSQSYSHEMVISGNGTLDGGSVSVSGSAPTSIGAYTGVVLVQ